MTTKTRNTIKLNSKDLFLAADIAANSLPCAGSLRETLAGTVNGIGTAYCIMGCIAAAVAQRRHIGFERAVETLFPNQEADFSRELTADLLGDSVNLVTTNDTSDIPDFQDMCFYGNKPSKKDMKLADAARKWQVDTLTELAMAAQEKEDNAY